MIKSELIALVAARNLHLYQRDIENVINAVFDAVTAGLEAGKRAELRGFGVFSVTYRPSYRGRNPRTGESVIVDEKWVPVFKAGREIGKQLNSKPTPTAVRSAGPFGR